MADQDIIGKHIGQYEVVGQIGQGGMATVYKAFQPSINRYVAIKILPSQYAQDPNFVKRFEHEARAIAALEHPHILPVYDFGTQDGLTYMVMRYVEGGTLSNLMGQPMPAKQVVRLIGAVARALDYAHKQGIVHRDIKPSNILIDKNGEPLLTDFGIAKKLIEGSGATQLTGSGTVLGTPAYMSPEQAKGQPVDGRSDIYSLGVVLYELLTGQQPYQAETPLGVVLKHVSEPLPPPHSVNPDVPAPLEQIVIKAMAKDPNQRYPSLAEMEQALQTALKEIEGGASTINVPSPPTGSTRPLTEAVPPAPKKSGMTGPLLIGGGIVAVLLCLLGGGLALFRLAASPDDTTPTVAGRTPVSIGIEKTATPTPASADLPPDSDTPTPELFATDELSIEWTATMAALEVEMTAAAATFDASLAAIATPDSSTDLPASDGEVVLEDTFESNQNNWHTGVEDDEYGHTEYSLTDGYYRITQEAAQNVFIWSKLRDTDFDNFVMSVEATPGDYTAPFGYGLTLRENFEGDLYVFELNTDGDFTVGAHQGGEWKTLQDWSPAEGAVADGPNQLTVRALDSSLTFSVNGQEVATIEDYALDRGVIGLGLELFEAGDKATIDFDNLVVQSLSSAGQALVQSDNGSSAILFEDTFDSDSSGWATGKFKDEYSQNEIVIQDGRYTMSVNSNPDKYSYVEKLLPNRRFDDFILTVEATPRDVEAHYSYGVAFREDEDGRVYVLEIGNDGYYAVLLYDEEWKNLKDWSTSPAIQPGETHKLMVSAVGETLTFYVNDVLLTTLQDDTLSEGEVGLVVDMAEGGKSATVDFDNLVIREP